MATTGTFRRRRLGRELMQLRKDRDLRSEDVAEAIGVSQPTLSRIERAAVEIRAVNVLALLEHYGVAGEQRDALLALARDAKKQSWWHVYGDALPEWFEVYVDLEGEASTIDTYEINVISGLLQTEDYARALITAACPEDAPEEIERRVELRMQRQGRLASGELRFRAIIDECALHRTYNQPQMMADQIRHLMAMAELRNVLLQILPTNSPWSTGSGFSILQFSAEDPTVAYTENELGALYMEKPGQVRHYSHLYERLRAAAMSPEASVQHLVTLLKE